MSVKNQHDSYKLHAMELEINYLNNIVNLFTYYKQLGEQAIAQLKKAEMHMQIHEESNSVAVIIQHMAGNSISRWTGFLAEDGEKPWRDRDREFENKCLLSRTDLINLWNSGWQCLFDAIGMLKPDDLNRTVYIRNEAHSVMEAINRQLAHLPYHIGQIVFIAKAIRGNKWKSLSIKKGESEKYNKKFTGQGL